MKKIFLMASLLLFSVGARAQRYMEDLFEKTQRATPAYLEKEAETLRMDIIQPEGDTERVRPVVLYVHGGGFGGGVRDNESQIAFCEQFARKGYVAVTMSYSLVRKGKGFGCDVPAAEKIETFRLTGRDISAATRYLVEHHGELGIDTNRIVLAGSSAGAEGILHAAYWDETKQGILAPTFQYGGVISMAGALIDERLIQPENVVPTQLFHGTCDNLVPYGQASHHYCDYGKPGYLPLAGAAVIADRLETLHRGFYLVTGCNDGHEWNFSPIQKHVDLITDFLYHDVVRGETRQIHLIDSSSGNKNCRLHNHLEICPE